MSVDTETANLTDDGAYAGDEGAEIGQDQAQDQADTQDQTDDEDIESTDEAGDGQSEDGQVDDDAEDVEIEGKTYRLPKAVKPLLMMEADYRQKTMTLADTRKAVEARGQAVELQVAAAAEIRQEIRKVEAIRHQVEAFNDINWSQALAEAAADPDNPAGSVAQVVAAQGQFNALKDQLRQAEEGLSAKENEFTQHRQAATAAALHEVGVVLASEIPNWSKGGAQKAAEAAQSMGYGIDELTQLVDPRAWRAFHSFAALQAENASLKAQIQRSTTTQRHAKSQGSTPAATVQAKGGFKAGLDDSLPADEWMRRRNAKVNRT